MTTTGSRHPWRRLAAWAIDWLCILGWVALTAAVGVPLFVAGVIRPTNPLLLNVIATLVIVVPVTTGLALLEHRFGATAGKRVLRLAVVAAEGRPSYRRALARNALKVALPWTIAHATVYAVFLDASASPVLVAAYMLPVVDIVALFVWRGRTPYDFATRTSVERVGPL